MGLSDSVIAKTSTMIGTMAMFLLYTVLFFQLHESCARLSQQEDGKTTMTIVEGYGPPGPNEDSTNTNILEQDTYQPLSILYWYHQFLGGQIIYPEYGFEHYTMTDDDETSTLGNNLLREVV